MNFTKKIIGWYHRNKRDLPWRRSQNPYIIWLSEVILQQTRVDQGMRYFEKFISTFPEVASLARSDEETVLKLWQGLGYYTRARNLHRTAQIIDRNFQGQFPEHYSELLKLPGVGEYTAAAISSIAFGQPNAVVDGNVVRVLSRIFGIDKPIDTSAGLAEIKAKANELIDARDPGTFNQAVMEFGALFCKPQNPPCQNCIFRADCIAFNQNKVDKLPVKAKNTRQRFRYFNYLIFVLEQGKKRSTLIGKRTGNDIWKNLYDFPVFESHKKLSAKALLQELDKRTGKDETLHLRKIESGYKHILTHQVIRADFFIAELRNEVQVANLRSAFPNQELKKVLIDELGKYPIPRLIEKFLNKNEI